jgi:HK97 gp10 family phage protein
MIKGIAIRDTANFRIEGVEDVVKRLDDAKIKNKVKPIRQALRFAAAPMKRDAKAMAPVRTGALKKAIGYINPQSKTQLFIYVGPRRKSTNVFYGHLVEFGTAPRKYRKPQYRKIGGKWVKVTHTGSTPAQPFMRPAFEKNKENIEKRFERKIKKLIVKAAAK